MSGAVTESVLHFVSPPPGLEPHTAFALAGVTPELYTLRAVEASDLRLFLLDPRPFFPDYSPDVPAEVLDEIGTTDPAVLVVVRPSDTGDEASANLLAPVLVNLETGAAVQVILEGSGLPLRAPLGQ